MLQFRCCACGEVHAIPGWIFHELAPDGIWARCPRTGKYLRHKLLSGPGFSRVKANGASLARSRQGLRRLTGISKIGRVGERVKGLLRIGASNVSP